MKTRHKATFPWKEKCELKKPSLVSFSLSVLTIVGGVVPAGPVCLAWPIGPPAGPIWPGLAWPCPMPMPMPIPCPWAAGCCWGPVTAAAPGCPGLAADVWACCWSWVLCPGAPSVWGPGPLCRPDPVGPPAGPWARAELLPDLEEPGWRKKGKFFRNSFHSLLQKCLSLPQELEKDTRKDKHSVFYSRNCKTR